MDKLLHQPYSSLSFFPSSGCRFYWLFLTCWLLKRVEGVGVSRIFLSCKCLLGSISIYQIRITLYTKQEIDRVTRISIAFGTKVQTFVLLIVARYLITAILEDVNNSPLVSSSLQFVHQHLFVSLLIYLCL